MSLNDKDTTLAGNRSADIYPGVANPTISSMNNDPKAANFVTDPTTEVLGAGAGPNFDGDRQATRMFSQTSGVVEGRPGIIESTNIDPLNENSNKDDGWANATTNPGRTATTQTATGMVSNAASGAATMATGAAQLAYGHAMGDEATKTAGREALWGKQ
ncbi:hypothetical protein HGRIS_013126 [Hohenbuehelia grisea]|uniref:Uncharacterized protein n=1 Tax=Hohenbuehelia grisea TaxID=104357 RepID=A0ABR3IUS1_9AGAR